MSQYLIRPLAAFLAFQVAIALWLPTLVQSVG